MDAFVAVFTTFVLAMFLGFAIITKVPPLLHTPLMSGSNAISGITIIGALLSVATPNRVSTVLGFVAVIFATINVVGGFLVTHRMLGMFKKKD
jgi:NAD(P) transhydrogenase subunit alpha